MKKCPLLNKDCIEGKCMWWTEMSVKNVVTGEMSIDKNCAISKLPMLLVEGLRSSNGIQAAVESNRNETVQRQDVLLSMLDSSRRLALAENSR